MEPSSQRTLYLLYYFADTIFVNTCKVSQVYLLFTSIITQFAPIAAILFLILAGITHVTFQNKRRGRHVIILFIFITISEWIEPAISTGLPHRASRDCGSHITGFRLYLIPYIESVVQSVICDFF